MNNNLRILHRSSKLFQPFTAIQKNCETNDDVTSKSQKLMFDNGIIKQASPGSFHLLPLGVRVTNKLTKLIDAEMQIIGAQKVSFPTLTHSKLWKKTGRYNDVSNEVFKLKDRHDSEYLLSPTHEEAAAEFIASLGLSSYKNYPLFLYQITSKFRDEMKPRFGLMRARQFDMKDLYTFDINTENARSTYELICECYGRILDKIGVDWVKVVGAAGTMGGHLSHEYHFASAIGEDKLLHCSDCKFAANLECLQMQQVDICPKCSSINISTTHGIEVGHTFLLGDKYTKALRCKYLGQDGKSKLLQMGSYGLGVSRMMAASVEVLSGEMAIRWPDAIAPFRVVVIGPKSGSNEETSISVAPEEVYGRLHALPNLHDDVLHDDRAELSIGKRLLEAKRTGYPHAIVVGGKATGTTPLLEVVDLYKQAHVYLSLDQIVDFFSHHVHIHRQLATN